MKAALGPEGAQALRELVRRSPLLAFDFDGTLAPIVARPADARVPPATARLLDRLARRWTVAIVTGRAVDDVASRLGFAPQHVVGNHGIEDPSDAQHGRWQQALEPLRGHLATQAPLLDAAGVVVEDKRMSIALHYRLAADPARAAAVIDDVLRAHAGALDLTGGKCVVNVMAAGAPDKGDAVAALVQRSGAGAALFVGDDLNDEAVFTKAPAHWMTVRIGRDHPASAARYVLDATADLPTLLQQLLAASPDR